MTNDAIYGPPLPDQLRRVLVAATRVARKPHLLKAFPMVVFQREDTGEYFFIAEHIWPETQEKFWEDHHTRVRRVCKIDAEVGEWQPRRVPKSPPAS